MRAEGGSSGLPPRVLDVPLGGAEEIARWLYGGIGLLAAVVVFIGLWGFACVSWGVLLGLTLGWAPAVVGAAITRYVWPLPVVVALWLWRHH